MSNVLKHFESVWSNTCLVYCSKLQLCFILSCEADIYFYHCSGVRKAGDKKDSRRYERMKSYFWFGSQLHVLCPLSVHWYVRVQLKTYLLKLEPFAFVVFLTCRSQFDVYSWSRPICGFSMILLGWSYLLLVEVLMCKTVFALISCPSFTCYFWGFKTFFESGTSVSVSHYACSSNPNWERLGLSQ